LGLGEGRARRLSLGAAATFAVAAVAGVVGGQLTGRITPALGVFAGLVVAGMLLTYWLDRSTRSSSPTDSGGSGGAMGSQGSVLRGSQQNIIAAAPGAIAQGAMGGNVINQGPVLRPSPAESAHLDASEEKRDGHS